MNSSMAVDVHQHIRGMKKGSEDPAMSPRVYCPCEGADLGEDDISTVCIRGICKSMLFFLLKFLFLFFPLIDI